MKTYMHLGILLCACRDNITCVKIYIHDEFKTYQLMLLYDIITFRR